MKTRLVLLVILTDHHAVRDLATLVDNGTSYAAVASDTDIGKDNDIIGFICADFVQSDGPGDKALEIIKTTAPQIELHLNSRGRRFKGLLARVLTGGG